MLDASHEGTVAHTQEEEKRDTRDEEESGRGGGGLRLARLSRRAAVCEGGAAAHELKGGLVDAGAALNRSLGACTPGRVEVDGARVAVRLAAAVGRGRRVDAEKGGGGEVHDGLGTTDGP